MTVRSALLRVHDMLEAIDGINNALGGVSFDDFAQSWILRSAIERGVEIISEASRHIPSDLKQEQSDIRWKDIAGIGDILRHEYQRVAPDIVWRAIHDYLPELRAALVDIAKAIE